MTATVNAGELYRVIWNALLFADKNAPAGPVVEFNFGKILTVRSADQYSGLIESIQLTGTTKAARLYALKEELQELAKKLKVEPNEEIEVAGLQNDMWGTAPVPEPWEDFDYLVNRIRPSSKTDGFAYSLDRLKLLYRIRSGRDYPVFQRVSEVPTYGGETIGVIQFRIGPDIRGYVAPLDDEVLEDDWKL